MWPVWRKEGDATPQFCYGEWGVRSWFCVLLDEADGQAAYLSCLACFSVGLTPHLTLFSLPTKWGPALYICYKMALAKGNTLVYEAGKDLRGKNGDVSLPECWVLEVCLLGTVFKGGPTEARDAVVNPKAQRAGAVERER